MTFYAVICATKYRFAPTGALKFLKETIEFSGKEWRVMLTASRAADGVMHLAIYCRFFCFFKESIALTSYIESPIPTYKETSRFCVNPCSCNKNIYLRLDQQVIIGTSFLLEV